VDKGSSTINRPHIFVVNTIINGPTMKGHNAFVQNAIGGWEFATITNVQSGNSLTVYNQGVSDANGSGLSSLSGTGFTQNQRPNASGVDCNASIAGAPREQIFNPGAFTVNGFQIGTIGTASRGICNGPSQINSDLAFYKNWKVKERLGIQFRLEFFNAFNHANFRGDRIHNQYTVGPVSCGAVACDPATNPVITNGVVNDPQFGQATATRGPREIQYAIKFNF
jgi:hypothetical protein